MIRATRTASVLFLGIFCVVVLPPCVTVLEAAESSPQAEAGQSVAEIVQATGVAGGLIVHLGCGDGRETAEMLLGSSYLVQGLDTDPTRVAEARRYIERAGLGGPVSVDTFDGQHLPYIDNVVNLVVAEDLGCVPMEEVIRVLAPGGVAYVKRGGEWRKTVKPRPEEIDDWTHFLHGADNNAVASDTLVDFPFHIQWVGWPKHARDHELASSTHVMVTAGARLFCIIDEGPTALPHYLPARWYLVARDAFNGIVLWKRPLAQWQPHVIRGRKSIAADLWRRLVATEKEVYVTETIFGPVVALDAATGETLRTYSDTERTEEILYDRGTLYVLATTQPPEAIDRRALAMARSKPDQKRLSAVDAATGHILWTRQDEETLGIHPVTLAVSGGRVFFQNTRAVVCLAASTGQTRWQYDRPSPFARPATSTPTLVVCDGVVLSADRASRRSAQPASELLALSADEGKLLWRCPCAENVGAGVDVFVAHGLVWVGENPRRAASDYNHGRHLGTGQIQKTFSHEEGWPTWHHHRCYRDKATVNYILAGRTGIEFVDLKSGDLTTHHWVRGVCEYGIMPANGLIYTPPDQCACYIQSKLHGFHALAPKRASITQRPALPPRQRLEKGPAYGQTPQAQAPFEPAEWPTFRHDNARSGYTPVAVSLALQPAWRRPLGGKLTTLVFADGRVFGAQKDTHSVFCLEGQTGELLWRFRTGGRVDSPPTISAGIAVFGSRDGYVYAVRVSDGQLIWRFQAAPLDFRLVENGHVASVWPVHGSVLVENGAVYFVAGRSSYFDGGIYLYKLDLPSGTPLITKNYYSRDPETGKRFDLFRRYPAELLPDRELPGLLPDVLSADSRHLYLRSVPISRQLAIQDKQYVPHLFGSMGFLEDTWWERMYWIYGVHCYSGARGHGYARTLFPAGRLLTFDDTSVYGYQDAGLTDEPVAFRAAKQPEFIDLASELARAAAKQRERRADAGRAKRQRGKKSLAKVDPEAIRRTFVWKNGIPQDPQAMQLTKRGALGDVIRRIVKYEFDWQAAVPLYPNAMVLDEKTFWMAGPPPFSEQEAAKLLASCPTEPFELNAVLEQALDTFAGKRGGVLLAADKHGGRTRTVLALPSPPVYDGMIAAAGRLYLALEDGSVICLGESL